MRRKMLGIGAIFMLIGMLALPAAAGDRNPPPPSGDECYETVTEYRYVKQVKKDGSWETATGAIAYDSGWVSDPIDITDRPGGPWVLGEAKKIGDKWFRYVEKTRESKVEIPCETTTTTTEETTTTTVTEETTTLPEETTTTTAEETTTTTLPDTYECVDGEVTVIGPDDPRYPGAVTDPRLLGCDEETTTTAPTPPTTEPDDPEELPFTGIEDGPWAGIAVALISIGGVLALGSRFFRDDETEFTDAG